VNDRFADLRSSIDRVDQRILALVNERLRLVEELWLLKTELGVDRVDPGREQEIRDGLRAANTGSLTDEGVDELIVELLALTKREQERRG
jgi:chorismate mutase/prephenate dehydratase